MNNTNPPHVQFFKKPVYSVMSLLSLLGVDYLQEKITSPDPLISILASRGSTFGNDPDYFALLLTCVNNTQEDYAIKRNVRLNVEGLKGRNLRAAVYKLDNVETNPFKIWQGHDSPVYPNLTVRSRIRESEVRF